MSKQAGIESIKAFIDGYQAMLPMGTSVSLREAEKRAGDFLYAQARLVDMMHMFQSAQIKAVSTLSAVNASLMSTTKGATMTEKKIAVEAADDYLSAREYQENVENDHSYLKAYLKIFSDAHIFYRQAAKGEGI